MGKSQLPNMQASNGEESLDPFESAIVPATWEDKDTDLVAQYEFHKKFLHIEDVDKLG